MSTETKKPFNEITPEEARKLWIADLRSGEYEQTKQVLCRDLGDNKQAFCCIGVACETFIKNGGKLNKVHSIIDDNYIYGEDRTGILPTVVQNWLGLAGPAGELKEIIDGSATALTKLNDALNYTFEQIANVVESGKVALATQTP